MHTQSPFLRQLSQDAYFYSLPALGAALGVDMETLPLCVRFFLENALRKGLDGLGALARWQERPNVAFFPGRVVLQDFTGLPLLVDLASMRDAVRDSGGDAHAIEPQVPVDLVIDHSVQVDVFGTKEALKQNLDWEFIRNRERYSFFKWSQQAFKRLKIVPPGRGIVHQVHLESLASLVLQERIEGKNILYPDTVVGTDSHTPMINGLGLLGWGVGGIEAQGAMLGQPIYLEMPKVVGVALIGSLNPGVTATDLVLFLTHKLREHGVVGSFVEFFGPGSETLSVAYRATLANMAPEYGATTGLFAVDEKTLDYLQLTGRSADLVERVRAYYQAQGLFGTPTRVRYSETLTLDLGSVLPCVAGPKRPDQHCPLWAVKANFEAHLRRPFAQGGYGQEGPIASENGPLAHGSVVLAAITSCTNTSNPSALLAAGLLAQAAVRRGLRVPGFVKTSMAPGSQAVTAYLKAAGLLEPLEALGFHIVGYGCTTCIGNSGPLTEAAQKAAERFVVASVLSGNRNFEARVHPAIKANFLMSTSLVVAYALAGRITIDFETEPLGYDALGQPVFLKDLWPSEDAIQAQLSSVTPTCFSQNDLLPQWEALDCPTGLHYAWDPSSTYIKVSPFFQVRKPVWEPTQSLRILALLGDNVTTDHISPAGNIDPQSPAGQYLKGCDVQEALFNSYGSRRGNPEVMARGTFANRRLKNAMAKGKEGPWTCHQPSGELLSIYEAAQRYQREGTPLIVFAGHNYGMGSSRDWAAKGPALLGVQVVVAQSFERIHRSNLVHMGILPLQWTGDPLPLNGEESIALNIDFAHLEAKLTASAHGKERVEARLSVRLDTPMEAAYYGCGGLLSWVMGSG